MASSATLKKLPGEVKNLIAQTITDVLSDPDFGLELTKKARLRLGKISQSKKTISLSAIKKKYR
ncbi:MAG: hypothetical protein AAB536_02230 [Patescibacteria group bacterium]